MQAGSEQLGQEEKADCLTWLLFMVFLGLGHFFIHANVSMYPRNTVTDYFWVAEVVEVGEFPAE